MYHRDKWSWVRKNFKLLRVLHDEKVEISVPKSIGTFIHLRYLTINLNGTRCFPKLIYNLTNLETLYVKGIFCVGYLPNGIFKLQRLKNLYIPRGLWLRCDSKVALGELHVLSVASIIYDPHKHSFPVVLDKFPNIWKLKISIDVSAGDKITEAKDIVCFPSHLAHLEILRIDSCRRIRGIPDSIPSTITKLTLNGGVFKVSGGMTELGKLPNLRILKLEKSHHSSDIKIHVIADSFPQLQVLKLRNLIVEEWKQERGAMPSLRHLVIKGCDKFSSAPELLSLTSLLSVEVSESPVLELQTKLQIKG